MLGEWRGGEFFTGHRMNGQLEKSRWFGNTFNSPADVQPLVCLDDDGNRFSNVKMGKGEASLWLEEFRGEVTATMVYDGQPVHDHFKTVDDDAVMVQGLGGMRSRPPGSGLFRLARVRGRGRG